MRFEQEKQMKNIIASSLEIERLKHRLRLHGAGKIFERPKTLGRPSVNAA